MEQHLLHVVGRPRGQIEVYIVLPDTIDNLLHAQYHQTQATNPGLDSDFLEFVVDHDETKIEYF